MKKYLLLLYLLAVILPAVASMPVALAQTEKSKVPSPTPLNVQAAPTSGINVSISPTFLNLVTDPGKEVVGKFTVRNNNSFTEYFQMDIAKFEQVSGGKPVLLEVTDKDTFTKWVQFSDQTFFILPNQTKTIKVSITPAEEASLGYYYAFIINRVKEHSSDAQGAVISGSPALLTLLEVNSPNARRELQLVNFKTDGLFYEYLPATFTVTVKNTGNVHIAPKGNIFIDQGDKKDLAILLPNESRGNVLPQTERDFSVAWNDGMIVREPKMVDGRATYDSNGKPVYTTNYDFDKPLSKFRIGKYTANLLLVYDNGERDVPLEASITFWVIPWKLISLGIGTILLPFVIFYLFSRLRRRKGKS